MNRSETIHKLCLLCCVLACPVLLGCDVPSQQIGQLDAESGDSTDDSTDSGSGNDSGSDSGGDDSLPASCQKGVDNLQGLFAGQIDLRCAIVLRSDYETGEIIGWQIPCRDAEEPELTVEDAQALTNWAGENISHDERNFVFYNEPLDSGGLAYVGPRSGVAFDGSIEIGGEGQVTKPLDLLDADWLGSGCANAGPEFAIEVYMYNLTEGDPDAVTPELQQALAQIWDTGVFYTIPDSQVMEAITMLAYPRTLDPFDPTTAEIVTIIDRGALE